MLKMEMELGQLALPLQGNGSSPPLMHRNKGNIFKA
jgi:hypothetical protein